MFCWVDCNFAHLRFGHGPFEKGHKGRKFCEWNISFDLLRNMFLRFLIILHTFVIKTNLMTSKSMRFFFLLIEFSGY